MDETWTRIELKMNGKCINFITRFEDSDENWLALIEHLQAFDPNDEIFQNMILVRRENSND